MSTVNEDHILRELKTQASKWVTTTLPDRLGGVGVDEIEVRKQLQTEADKWVQFNLRQRLDGKEGTPSPDFHLYEERPATVPPEWKMGRDIPHISDEEC